MPEASEAEQRYYAQVNRLADEFPTWDRGYICRDELKALPEVKEVATYKRGELPDLVAAAGRVYMERDALAYKRTGMSRLLRMVEMTPEMKKQSQSCFVVKVLLERLLTRKLPTDLRIGEVLMQLIWNTDPIDIRISRFQNPWLDQMEALAELGPLPEHWHEPMARIYKISQRCQLDEKERKFVDRLGKLTGDVAEDAIPIERGDVWCNRLLEDLQALEGEPRKAWIAALNHASTISAAKPAKKWIAGREAVVEAVGVDTFHQHVREWLSHIGEPGEVGEHILRTHYSDDDDPTKIDLRNVDTLRGLVWLLAGEAQSTEALRDLAIICYRPVKGDRRCEPVANAAVRALASIPGEAGLIQLFQLEQLIKLSKPKKLIAKMIKEAAEREGLDPERLKESAVPDFGMVDGVVRRAYGEYAALITTRGDKASIKWLKPDGKTTRIIPKALKEAYPKAGDEVKSVVKELEVILQTQRSRVEQWMRYDHAWPADRWRGEYLEHGLIGAFAKRLIWTINGTPALWHDEAMRDSQGGPVEVAGEVRLWHPIDRPTDEVISWRDRIESLQVSQPFKQTHREVYLLTDAERQTEVYSNRFAAHILKNTAMVALCRTRGWISGLMGGESGPRLDLVDHGLRVEFWVEPAGDEDTEQGFPRYVATDQVRFYAITPEDAARYGHTGGVLDPLPLDRVPAKALTETLRDVDMLVGICSVGNNPEWNDGGPLGQFQQYWQDYSFGDLSATAKTRKELLERLVPRLKIAARCSFNDKFLVVKGDARTYKIHLGSANILMEPNDQYLCIVPGRGKDTGQADKMYLPFEGDRTLSIILSKAFMLAEDTKITDKTIISQIRR